MILPTDGRICWCISDSVHVSLCLWKLCTAWGWHLSPSCWEFWEMAKSGSVVWLTWLLQSQLSYFIFTSVTCPLVPLFQLPLYLLWHFVPNIMLTGTTNLLHLLWFEKCSQNPSSQLLCVFLQKKSVPFVILHLLPEKAFSISYISLNWKDGISLPPWHIVSHLGDQEITISTNGFHERIVWWIIFVVDSLSS